MSEKHKREMEIRIMAACGFDYAHQIGWKTSAQMEIRICFQHIENIAWAADKKGMHPKDYRRVMHECARIRFWCREGRIHKSDVVNLWKSVRAIEQICNDYLQPSLGEVLHVDFKNKTVRKD